MDAHKFDKNVKVFLRMLETTNTREIPQRDVVFRGKGDFDKEWRLGFMCW